jgi:hypothetical protein
MCCQWYLRQFSPCLGSLGEARDPPSWCFFPNEFLENLAWHLSLFVPVWRLLIHTVVWKALHQTSGLEDSGLGWCNKQSLWGLVIILPILGCCLCIAYASLSCRTGSYTYCIGSSFLSFVWVWVWMWKWGVARKVLACFGFSHHFPPQTSGDQAFYFVTLLDHACFAHISLV